jgi:S-adenosylmethionine synthetase
VNGGAQGTSIVYGYATKQTREFLPKAVVYANALARRIEDLRRTDQEFSFFQPDGKVQMAMDGDRVISLSLSVQHNDNVDITDVQRSIVDQVVHPVVGEQEGMKLHINSAGKFCSGGFAACGGASGRKELSDTYGGLLPSGGATYTGKDPRQPARCGMYMSRYVAKQLVSEGTAGNMLITVGYTIGHTSPTFLRAVTGAGKDITSVVEKRFDFRPEAIIERLQLTRPMYGMIATFGQFGREGLPWEEIDENS